MSTDLNGLSLKSHPYFQTTRLSWFQLLGCAMTRRCSPEIWVPIQNGMLETSNPFRLLKIGQY